MSLDEATEDDVIREVDGVTFVMEEKLARKYEGIKIQYKKTILKKGFIVTLLNPTEGYCR